MSAATIQPFTAAHRSYVKTLYRRSLKDALNWYVRRDLYQNKAIELRAYFEQHRETRDPRAVAAMLQRVEKEMAEFQHPDPYKAPLFPDGTKWERNIPPKMFSQEEKEAALHAH